ncbi:MAG: hypothetical protein FWD58_05615 [Firmicutes bacterium]|nr:hypothetical protein [Bacillota bacterium]
MKDPFIEQRLYEYAEAVKPGKELIAPAVAALRAMRPFGVPGEARGQGSVDRGQNRGQGSGIRGQGMENHNPESRIPNSEKDTGIKAQGTGIGDMHNPLPVPCALCPDTLYPSPEPRAPNPESRTPSPESRGRFRLSSKRVAAFTALFSAAAAVLIFFGVLMVNLLPDANKGADEPSNPPPPAYALSSLTYNVTSIEEVENAVLTLRIGENGLEELYANARAYYAKNNAESPTVISVLYKTVGDGGLDEIVVIADMKGGLKDYKSFKNYSDTAEVKGVEVRLKQRQENGEFYTDAYFRHGDIDYYLKLASPMRDVAERYVGLLLG